MYFPGKELLSNKTLFVIQTSLLATKLRELPLTIRKDYYSIVFDWLQEIDFNEHSVYLYPETFRRMIQLLKLVIGNPDLFEELDDLYSVSKKKRNNHKHLLWSIIRSY